MTDNIRVVRLTQDYQFKSFDCGNQDLNDFLLSDSKPYLNKLLSVTYILENDDDIVAYFSVSNDKISIPDSDRATWRRIKALFPHSKHRSDYPAVKVGRLAVNIKYRNNGIGSDILNFVKQFFISNNRTGCSFITVDALREAIHFYLKNDFKYLDKASANSNSDTCLMYYDLTKLVD